MAAQVPYSPIPDVTQQFTPVRAGGDINAFGGDIGRALSTLGQTSDAVGNELFGRAIAMQDLHNQAESDQGVTSYMEQLAQKHAEFTSKNGENAGPAALAQYGQDIADLRTQIRGGLSNPMAQRYYDRETLSTMGRTFFNAAQHSGQQMQAYSLGALASKNEATTNMVMTSPSDPRTVQAGLASDVETQRELGKIKGLDDATINNNIKVAQSKTILKQVAALSAGASPEAAKAAFDKARDSGQLVGEDITTGSNILDKQLYSTGAKNISDTIRSQMPGASVSDTIAAGRALALKTAPDRPLLGDAVANQIETDYAREERAAKDDQFTTQHTIADGLSKAVLAGKPITDINQLGAQSPEMAQAIAKLDPEEQLKVQFQIKKALSEDNTPSPARQANFNKLSGMPFTDPEGFKGIDLAGQDLTKEQRGILLGDQKKVLAGQDLKDPLLDFALKDSDIKQQLGSLGLGMHSGDDKDGYQKFVGALKDELNAARENGKTPSYSETREIAKQLLTNQVSGQSLWGYGPDYHDRLYNIPPPDDKIPGITKQLQTYFGRAPTEQEIQHAWTRQLFKDSLKKKDTQ
jgi:hypothetical protein